jgi:glycosyltransferase involved in cell wall biosynthesis
LIIPNGIAADKFRADRPKKKIILLVTRMFERKGVQYFLQAVRHLETDYHIHIVGDGPYLDTLKGMARDLPMPVTFHGYVDNHSQTLRDLFETARIFVFTSEVENFPIVLLEAMLAGTTIISTEGTGCAEVVGKAARLVPPRAPGDIRTALEELIWNPEISEQLGRKARERVERHFTWETVARKYLILLNNVSYPEA